MSDIISERSGSILRVELNRPERKNAMTSKKRNDVGHVHHIGRSVE